MRDPYKKIENVYYFPGAPNLITNPHQWDHGREEIDVGQEGTYLKVMGKRSILVWNNRAYQQNILHVHGCTLL